jgi:tryptophan halogenase
VVAGQQLLHPSNSFGMDGYLVMLVGQGVAHGKPYAPPPNEAKIWRDKCLTWAHEARRGLNVQQCLEAIRRPGMKWG